MKMNEKEFRSFDFEIRAAGREDGSGTLTGVPIVFEQETDLGLYRETIDRHALDDADLKDVRFLVNHDTSKIPLARSRNNNANSSMQMTVEEDGMHIRVNLDTENNSEAKSLYSAVKRGDISGMSFMFTVEEDKWADLESEQPTRRVLKIGKVFEVSACTFPAYPQTAIGARSAAEALENAKATLENERRAEEEIAKRNSLIEEIKNLCEVSHDNE